MTQEHRTEGRLRDPRHPCRLRARRDDRLGDPADLRDLDLQAGRGGGMRGGYEYSRSGNPTRTALEGNIAALEEGERGFAFASGLAAEDTLLRAICDPGDHVVIPDDAYGGTHRLFDKVLTRWGLANSTAAGERRRRRPCRDRARPDPGRLGRDTDQPAAEHRRHRGARRCGPRGRRAARRRQHLRLVVPPAAADPGRRRRRALDHQVRRRPLRRRRRRPRRTRPRAGRAHRVPPELDGRGRRPVRRLAGAARAEDARRADGPALRQRGEGGRVPLRPPRGEHRCSTRVSRSTPATRSPAGR